MEKKITKDQAQIAIVSGPLKILDIEIEWFDIDRIEIITAVKTKRTKKVTGGFGNACPHPK